jgi:hypothetical protein
VKRLIEARLKIITLAMLVSYMILPGLVRAVDYTPGVKAGDWIKYGQYTVTWSGNGTEPSRIAEEKNVDWLRLDVENISGATVTLNETNHFINGTQTSENSNLDVTGSAGMSGVNLLIACNLKDGETLTSQANSPTINQTTRGVYAGASRSVNLAETTSVYDNQTITTKIYWDQSTGAMVETYSKSPDYGNLGAFTEFSVKATETNMWSPDLPLTNNLIFIVAGIIVIIAVVAAVIVLKIMK